MDRWGVWSRLREKGLGMTRLKMQVAGLFPDGCGKCDSNGI